MANENGFKFCEGVVGQIIGTGDEATILTGLTPNDAGIDVSEKGMYSLKTGPKSCRFNFDGQCIIASGHESMGVLVVHSNCRVSLVTIVEKLPEQIKRGRKKKKA
jgi:hypothetical protein